jgi:ABC-type multidrug transport system fused ATPase/permease subunit
MKEVWSLFRKGLTILSADGRRTLFSYGFALFALAILDGIALFFISRVFSAGSSNSSSIDTSAGGSTLIIVVILFSLRTGLSTLASWFALRRLANEETAIGRANYLILIGQSATARHRGSISDLHNGVDRGPAFLVQAYLVNVVSIAAEASSAVVILGALLFLQPATALIASVYFILVAVVQHRLLSRRSSRAGEIVVDRTNRVYEALGDSFALSKLLAVNPSNSLELYVNRQRSDLSLARARVVFLSLLPRYFMELILAVGLAVIAGVTYAFGDTRDAVSAVTVFAAAGFRLLPIVNRIQSLILQLFSSHAIAKLAFLEGVPTTESACVSSAPDREEVVLELRNVSFSYSNSATFALVDVSVKFEHGKQYAVIGPSGAGKTTLIDLCLGVLQPTTGALFERPRTQKGYVPQDTHVAHLNLLGNIAVEWSPEAIDYATAIAALSQARLEGLGADRAPDELLSDATLSGGQRQRIGLARALYRRPDIFFLDEVTSALDVETEHSVMQAVHDLKGKSTVVIVAHRLSTVQHADRVIYVDQGRVQGIGTFEELRRNIPSLQRQIELGSLTFDA